VDDPPRICVVIPVFNHGGTVRRVAREAGFQFPVIVVDDGSTDNGPGALAAESGITLLTLPSNRGKAEALRAGFAWADEGGFTHAITLDADGQHPTDALGAFAAACRRHPEAFVIGVRDLRRAGAPTLRRLSNALSNFCFKLETGVHLPDTQCGYRVYPLRSALRLGARAARYAFELEILVRAAWSNLRLQPLPVSVDYAAPTSRLSHFQPVRDFLRILAVHLRLLAQAPFLRAKRSGPRTLPPLP
jgi:glycosyltransferase involved in cell wall biosynthesis